jgi:hypothetical protein
MDINYNCPICRFDSNLKNPIVLDGEEEFLCDFCAKNMSHEDVRMFLSREENESFCDYRVRMRLKRLFLGSTITMLKKPMASGYLMFLFCQTYKMIKSNKTYAKEFFNSEYSSSILDSRATAGCCITCGEQNVEDDLECKHCDHESDFTPGFNFEIDNNPT